MFNCWCLCLSFVLHWARVNRWSGMHDASVSFDDILFKFLDFVGSLFRSLCALFFSCLINWWLDCDLVVALSFSVALNFQSNPWAHQPKMYMISAFFSLSSFSYAVAFSFISFHEFFVIVFATRILDCDL